MVYDNDIFVKMGLVYFSVCFFIDGEYFFQFHSQFSSFKAFAQFDNYWCVLYMVSTCYVIKWRSYVGLQAGWPFTFFV